MPQSKIFHTIFKRCAKITLLFSLNSYKKIKKSSFGIIPTKYLNSFSTNDKKNELFKLALRWSCDQNGIILKSRNILKNILKMLNIPNFSSKLFEPLSFLTIYYSIGYSSFKYVPLEVVVIDFLTGENQDLKNMKKIKNKKISLKIDSKIKKSRKSGIITSKRIYTQHTLDFEKNACVSNLSIIKIKNCFFGNYNKIF